MKSSCINVKVPLKKKSMGKVKWFLEGLCVGLLLGKTQRKTVQKKIFPFSLVSVGGIYALYHNQQLFQEKSFKMVTRICVHCPPGGYGVNCYFKE